MKTNFLRLGVLAAAFMLLLSSCDKKEDGLEIDNASPIEFIASMPSAGIDAVDTKTTTTDGTRVLWCNNDHISIFRGRNVNEEYKVKDGFSGKTTTTFVKANDDEFSGGSGDPFEANIAYYPYGNVEYIGSNGSHALNVTIPSTQTYAKGSFGEGSLPMVAVTSSKSDNALNFKNVFGFLKLQLKSTDEEIKIKSITIKGNNDEKLSGTATINCSAEGAPTIEFGENAGNSITLECNNTAINAATATDFWIALPPVTFSKGITVEIVTSAATIEKKTSAPLTITRSKVKPMEVLTVKAELDIPDANFKKYLLANCDMNKDGRLTFSDVDGWNSSSLYKKFDLQDGGISSLKGIGYFRTLDELWCRGNYLTTLDLSKNTALTRLECNGNMLTSLDLSNNTALEYLNCNDNLFTTLDLRNNTALTDLYCNMPSLKTLYLMKGHEIYGITKNRSTNHINENTEIVFMGGLNDAYVLPEINLETFNYNEMFDGTTVSGATPYEENFSDVAGYTWEQMNDIYNELGLDKNTFKTVYTDATVETIINGDNTRYDKAAKFVYNFEAINVDTYAMSLKVTPYSKFGENTAVTTITPSDKTKPILVIKWKWNVVKPVLALNVVEGYRYNGSTTTATKGMNTTSGYQMQMYFGEAYNYAPALNKIFGNAEAKKVNGSTFDLVLAKDYADKKITMAGTAYGDAETGVTGKATLAELFGTTTGEGILLGLGDKLTEAQRSYDLNFIVHYINGEDDELTRTVVFINPIEIKQVKDNELVDLVNGNADEKDFAVNYDVYFNGKLMVKGGVAQDGTDNTIKAADFVDVTAADYGAFFELVNADPVTYRDVTKVSTEAKDGKFQWKNAGTKLQSAVVAAYVTYTFKTPFSESTVKSNIIVIPEE